MRYRILAKSKSLINHSLIQYSCYNFDCTFFSWGALGTLWHHPLLPPLSRDEEMERVSWWREGGGEERRQNEDNVDRLPAPPESMAASPPWWYLKPTVSTPVTKPRTPSKIKCEWFLRCWYLWGHFLVVWKAEVGMIHNSLPTKFWNLGGYGCRDAWVQAALRYTAYSLI